MIDQTELNRIKALAEAATNDGITLYRSTALSEKTYQLGKVARAAIPALIAGIERLNAALFNLSDISSADLSAARMKVENLEAEVARLTRERDEAFKADGFHWSDTKHVPGTSIVSGGAMLLAADGHCVGLVTVLQCESEAVRVDVERALASASNPAKMRRFINAARSGEAEANERAEKGEAERDAALAQRDRLREALTNMLALFGSPHSDEYCDGGASYRLAVKTVEDARAALSEDKS